MAGKIVSGMEGGIDLENGLTAEGLEQARAAGRELKEVMLKAGCLPANTIVSHAHNSVYCCSSSNEGAAPFMLKV